jgi:hypothetical protein
MSVAPTRDPSVVARTLGVPEAVSDVAVLAPPTESADEDRE